MTDDALEVKFMNMSLTNLIEVIMVTLEAQEYKA